MILVAGGTGRLGSIVVRRLLSKGETVRVMTRTPEHAAALQSAGAEIVQGDVREPQSLARACQGAQEVVSATQALTGSGDNNPETVDVAGHRHLVDAARQAGVRHFVHISVQGAAPDSGSEWVRIKYAGEQYLKAAGLSYTILRPTAFMEFWAAQMLDPIQKSGKTTLFGSGDVPANYVSVEDVADYVIIALSDPRAREQTIEIGGPENLTANQMVSLFEKVSGRTAKTSHIPLPVIRVMSVAVRPINPTIARLMRLAVWSNTVDQTFDGREATRKYGVVPTRLEEVVKRRYCEPVGPSVPEVVVAAISIGNR